LPKIPGLKKKEKKTQQKDEVSLNGETFGVGQGRKKRERRPEKSQVGRYPRKGEEKQLGNKHRSGRREWRGQWNSGNEKRLLQRK